MFGTNKKLLCGVGLAVAGVITIGAAFYEVDHFIARRIPPTR
jgi:hypothetical protein